MRFTLLQSVLSALLSVALAVPVARALARRRFPGRGLLITLEYPQHERAGPPFSVREDEVHALYDGEWNIELRERRPIPPEHPGFVSGVSRVDTAVYALDRR